jgi:hypothetical protein
MNMKYARMLHASGAILVIVFAMMKILHLGEGYINVNSLLIFGLLVGYASQLWKVRILEAEIKGGKISASAEGH